MRVRACLKGFWKWAVDGTWFVEAQREMAAGVPLNAAGPSPTAQEKKTTKIIKRLMTLFHDFSGEYS